MDAALTHGGAANWFRQATTPAAAAACMIDGLRFGRRCCKADLFEVTSGSFDFEPDSSPGGGESITFLEVRSQNLTRAA